MANQRVPARINEAGKRLNQQHGQKSTGKYVTYIRVVTAAFSLPHEAADGAVLVAHGAVSDHQNAKRLSLCVLPFLGDRREHVQLRLYEVVPAMKWWLVVIMT